MLARLIDWYVSTPNPAVAGARAFVRRHPGLRSFGRTMLALALAPRAELRRRLRPALDPKLAAMMDARQTGGALSIADLEELWDAGARARRVLTIGEAPELDQAEIALRGTNPSVTITRSRAKQLDASGFDLVAEVPQPGRTRANQYGLAVPAKAAAAGTLREKLKRGDALHVVILNDSGFAFGAGIAARRQAASLLLRGWRVSLVTWALDRSAAPAVTGVAGLAQNFAAYSVPDTARVIQKIAALGPDLVLLGTLHGSGWPLGIISELRAKGIAVVAYMHDCHFVTGRCAYMGTCTKFLSGCDAACPTADEPPRLARDKIAPAWRERADLFSGSAAVPLVANSCWTKDIAVQRFAGTARTDIVHLGLDHDLFAPLSKSVVRRLLALPQDRTIVAMGAFDLNERRKGGHLAQALCAALTRRNDVAVVTVGGSSSDIAGVHSFGRIEDERLIPLILNAADILVSTATEEAFGQMLLEASACAVPVVAFDVGGVRDVVAPEETGLLVKQTDADDLIGAVERLIADPELRERLGRNGRARVEREFTLSRQAEAWIACLQRLF
jgi:glycosyltransferase involved in cell wall biosynthesis